MDLIASSINRAHGETTGVTVVLENVAGQVYGEVPLAALCSLTWPDQTSQRSLGLAHSR